MTFRKTGQIALRHDYAHDWPIGHNVGRGRAGIIAVDLQWHLDREAETHVTRRQHSDAGRSSVRVGDPSASAAEAVSRPVRVLASMMTANIGIAPSWVSRVSTNDPP